MHCGCDEFSGTVYCKFNKAQCLKQDKIPKKQLHINTRGILDFIFSYTAVCISSFYYTYVGWKRPTL